MGPASLSSCPFPSLTSAPLGFGSCRTPGFRRLWSDTFPPTPGMSGGAKVPSCWPFPAACPACVPPVPLLPSFASLLASLLVAWPLRALVLATCVPPSPGTPSVICFPSSCAPCVPAPPPGSLIPRLSPDVPPLRIPSPAFVPYPLSTLAVVPVFSSFYCCWSQLLSLSLMRRPAAALAMFPPLSPCPVRPPSPGPSRSSAVLAVVHLNPLLGSFVPPPDMPPLLLPPPLRHGCCP
ncbi:unnamed protein product [Prunus armeniaca]|uniref:Uncharacterized protein n=1 Tax=Prunus armeniaca TaxID=36596 RepID=A0A6J5V7V3_PRUAR|nr:unnamed protein product [Prunus armeniaca]